MFFSANDPNGRSSRSTGPAGPWTARRVDGPLQQRNCGGHANGTAVIDDLRPSGPGLIAVEPHGGKMARANVAAPFVEAGNILLPNVQQFLITAGDDGKVQMVPTNWADSFIEEHAAFPNSANDDWVDTLSQAVIRATQGRLGFIEFLRLEAEAVLARKKAWSSFRHLPKQTQLLAQDISLRFQ